MNQAPTKKTIPNSLEIRTVPIKEKVACPLFLCPLFLLAEKGPVPFFKHRQSLIP